MSETDKKKEQAQAANPASIGGTAEAARETGGAVMYIGPTILRDGLKRGTVYKQKPEDLIAEASKKRKNIGRLFVPIKNLGKARQEIAQRGTPLFLANQEAEEGK